MKLTQRWIFLCLGLVILANVGFAQKVKTGYSKATDFSKYKSYTWAPLGMPIARPILFHIVTGTVDDQLQSKGLTPTDHDGDMTLIIAGSLDMASNLVAGTPILSVPNAAPPSMNSGLWIGANVSWAVTGNSFQQGTLVLEFVDRRKNEVLWIGTVKQNIDLTQKEKSMDLVAKAITKLLKEFPPKPTSKR
jgi:hypothetical protein